MAGKRNWKRSLVGFLLAAVMLAGCAKADSGSTAGAVSGNAAGPVPKAGVASSKEEAPAGEQSMGRYLETELTLPEEFATLAKYPSVYLQMLEDGSLAALDTCAGIYTSPDRGETWERKDSTWLTKLADTSYVADVDMAPDGGAAVIYSPHEEDEEEDEDDGYRPAYRYISPSGEEKDLPLQSNENGYVKLLRFGRDNRLYAFDLDHKVHEVDTEKGTAKELFETQGLADSVCFTDRYLVVFASGGVSVYDLEQQIQADDQTLNDFIMDNLLTEIGANSDGFSVVGVSGEQEDVIYFAFDKGIYRHVIGGSAIEQVVDGSLCSLGDPRMLLRGMALLPDNEFAILYRDGGLYRYTYDPDVPTVPTEQMTVYSLYEDYTIRQAVSLYQKGHPEVYVKYEIGLTGSEGATSEDAIKNLNTRMLAGNGPDVLVLDNLPEKSYEEKGILKDLSGIAEGLKESKSLFPNLAEAFEQDGKIYELPVRFRIPMIFGPSKVVGEVKDLSSLADAVEELRQENPKGGLTGWKLESEVLYTLGLTSCGAWLGGDGQIDKAALAEYLEAARRIYQAEIAGLDEQELEDYKNKRDQERWDTDITSEGHYYANAMSNAIDIGMGASKMGAGISKGIVFDFDTITTLKDQEEDFDYGLWQGQVENCFIPGTRAGICQGSRTPELAEDFFRFLFGEELQDIELPAGFPVNPVSFEKLRENQISPGEEAAGGIAISSEDGDMFSLECKWPEKEDFDRLKGMAESLTQASIGDSAVLEAVYETGPKALNGTCTVDAAVEEILRKAAIYLAE